MLLSYTYQGKSCSRYSTNGNYGGVIDRVSAGEANVARVIANRTELTRNHMTPELQLFLLTPSCELYNAKILDSDEMEREVFSDPFWSIYWPGGQALTRFVLDKGRPLVWDRNVLDLGAGCGATAIAAKLAGAARVVANDINEVACTAISMNALVNQMDVQVSRENLLRAPPDTSFDVIFIGDMLYDEVIANELIPWVERARRNGARIYLGDPGRHGLTEDLKKRLKIQKKYSLPEHVRRENYGYDECSVWEFCG